jgi:NAD(P)-dependent dehydrogenase (short-subunit alcohol dehydrogenase family)
MTEIAVVTGASRGIGFEVCRQLAQRDMTVILTARDIVAGMNAVATLAAEGGDVRFHPLDVTDELDVINLVDVMWERFGRVQVLVNNAAAPIDWAESATDADLKRAAEVMDTNLFGAWRVTQGLLPLLRVTPGARVVNVSRAGGAYGNGEFGLYANAGRPAGYGVAKAALHALTCALAGDLSDSTVLVNAVCPGLTAESPALTDLGARPLKTAAAGIVWAATLPPDGPRGGLFRDRVPQPW